MKKLNKIILEKFTLESGLYCDTIPLFYQTFGPPLGTAPLVVVNHALTGNSTICGDQSWWDDFIGVDKTIDTNYFSIIAFNIPGNGYDGLVENLISDYQNYNIRDVARLFWLGIFQLGIKELFAVVGGSLGGAVAWEMATLYPKLIKHLIPIATDWKATDWVIANVLIQDQILNNSDDPIVDARLHAMLLYRTPKAINDRFQRQKQRNLSMYQIENWLIAHGLKLKKRFRLSAYKLMNHLLKTNDITRNRADFITVASSIESDIHLVSVDSDYFFIAEENIKTFKQLKPIKENVFYHEIKSNHGHDAFLIEFEQLNHFLSPIFNSQKIYVHN